MQIIFYPEKIGPNLTNRTVCYGLVVGKGSPVKEIRKTAMKCFEGRLSDGRRTVRVVSFDPKLDCQFKVTGYRK